ncbi:phosphate ABC transporter substrate-binding protein [Heliorestis acidaminivorans]|uniref:Phosphate ABC transporter substrate-binding protein n=1 Tax=Heliorestis acidaminivorans TaxID=553427 RepID=A0A6I0F4F2_9FIRM|nr:phosphate ABC transporter substrate-binding protein [Heliorestis acidaminivorans]KAB2953452.1 phosphate ABC transporter substrate-binding protein [Heliorestis acidaminivorans]
MVSKRYRKPYGVLLLLAFIIGSTLATFTIAQSAQAMAALRVTGATTLQPVAEELAEIYKDRYGGEVHIEGGGSGTGINNVVQGQAQLGAVSRALRDSEKALVQYKTVGYDALVFIVNEQNPIEAIDKDLVVKIFQGHIKNWNEVTAWNQPVTLVSKEQGRATLDLFEEYSQLAHQEKKEATGQRIAKEAFEIGSNLEGATLTGGIPGAIGYVSLGTAQSLLDRGMPIKILALDGVAAEQRTVQNGTYPIIRDLLFVYKDQSNTINQYLDLYDEESGQQIMQSHGFVPAN